METEYAIFVKKKKKIGSFVQWKEKYLGSVEEEDKKNWMKIAGKEWSVLRSDETREIRGLNSSRLVRLERMVGTVRDGSKLRNVTAKCH